MISNTDVRLANGKSANEIVRFDLSEDASTQIAMIFAKNNYYKDSR